MQICGFCVGNDVYAESNISRVVECDDYKQNLTEVRDDFFFSCTHDYAFMETEYICACIGNREILLIANIFEKWHNDF